MDYTTLGRTGLRVSRMGLAGGGQSRLGASSGTDADGSVAIVRRAIGVTEAFNADTRHEMLERAVADDRRDLMMIGFDILNQSARRKVLPAAIARHVGTLCMFAVRAALSLPERLAEVVAGLIESGQLDRHAVKDPANPLGFLAAHAGVTDAAYRFCRDEPGMHLILSGTGNLDHLEQNAASLAAPPLPAPIRDRLIAMFRNVDSVSGQ